MRTEDADPIRYHAEAFGAELDRVRSATSIPFNQRISIVSLIPGRVPGGFFAECAVAFSELRRKPLFLFCYFFSTLIDQAIHSSIRQEHPHFDRLPNLVGILGTIGTNLHPALLLLAATFYVNEKDAAEATAQFNRLADFFVDDYYDLIDNRYPALTGRLSVLEERRQALRSVFQALSAGVALLRVPRSLEPYSSKRPNLVLFESWIGYFSRRVNERLDGLESDNPAAPPPRV